MDGEKLLMRAIEDLKTLAAALDKKAAHDTLSAKVAAQRTARELRGLASKAHLYIYEVEGLTA